VLTYLSRLKSPTRTQPEYNEQGEISPISERLRSSLI
jgi:hypothetical protein